MDVLLKKNKWYHKNKTNVHSRKESFSKDNKEDVAGRQIRQQIV